MEYRSDAVDVAIIGAGHAGVEAGLASARLGVDTILFTMSLDALANMPCNPSIGGTAKGHLVREIDALGGEMGKAADVVFLQSRMLNRGKGPAVHSLRVQADRAQYHLYMKQAVESQPGLRLKQAEIVEVRPGAAGGWEVVTGLGAVYNAKAVVLSTGTFLNGKIFVGDVSYDSGPDGLHAATRLSDSLQGLGIRLRRFKTGTPARVHRDSIDFSRLEVQEGDTPVVPFSFGTTGSLRNRVVCHIAYTNGDTHALIRENLHRSPLYGGKIHGVGTRYCPSIEDKVVRFADKERHQIFVEPMGLSTKEMYLQGVSTSLPEEVQVKLYRTIKGLEKVEIMRNAYAIEYDTADPLQLAPTLEFLELPALFGAGQFNGTSGYEEAAAQGLIAGINGALLSLGREPFVLERPSSYIGTLIDDLVTKGCMDPYRMMTSRSEYRLILRQDNADERLTGLGRSLGLIDDTRWEMYQEKQEQINRELKRVEKTVIPPSAALNELLEARGTSPVTTGMRLPDLLRRPQVDYESLEAFDPERPQLPTAVWEQVEIQIKYEGYIKKQLAQVAEQARLEKTLLPEHLDYQGMQGLRLEAREKLSKIRPRSLGQASRISGVTPADIGILLILLERERGGNANGIDK